MYMEHSFSLRLWKSEKDEELFWNLMSSISFLNKYVIEVITEERYNLVKHIWIIALNIYVSGDYRKDLEDLKKHQKIIAPQRTSHLPISGTM